MLQRDMFCGQIYKGKNKFPENCWIYRENLQFALEHQFEKTNANHAKVTDSAELKPFLCYNPAVPINVWWLPRCLVSHRRSEGQEDESEIKWPEIS